MESLGTKVEVKHDFPVAWCTLDQNGDLIGKFKKKQLQQQSALKQQPIQRRILFLGEYYISAGKKTPGGGVLPYMGYIVMCRCEGNDFQAITVA